MGGHDRDFGLKVEYEYGQYEAVRAHWVHLLWMTSYAMHTYRSHDQDKLKYSQTKDQSFIINDSVDWDH